MARARSPQACFICVCEWSKYKRLACNVSPTLRWTRKARKAIEPIQKRMNATKPKPSILGSRRSPTLRKISRILICYNLPYFLLIIPFNYYVIFFTIFLKDFPDIEYILLDQVFPVTCYMFPTLTIYVLCFWYIYSCFPDACQTSMVLFIFSWTFILLPLVCSYFS